MNCDINVWRENIIKEAQLQLSLSFPDEVADPTLLKMFLKRGVSEITKRRKLTNDDEFTRGDHDYTLVRFIVRSYNEGGIEGVVGTSSLGVSRNFSVSPLAELKQNTLQVI